MADIRVGCALSDENRSDLPQGLHVPECLMDYARYYQSRTDTNAFFFELQPEEWWTTPTTFPDQFTARETNRWWRTWHQDARFAALLKTPGGRIGMHQPIQGRDVLSSNFFQKYTALEETKQAMSFAHAIGADYFVFHLATTDRWEWDRRDQMTKALKMFKAFSAFYQASDFKFTPCVEILEYPKFPATGGEAIALLAKCQEILPGTKLAFDISHLWGARQRMIAAQTWYEEGGRGVSFVDSLEYALSRTWDDIHVFHLGGCWESETHAVPGLHPQQDPRRTPMKLRHEPNVYAEAREIDLNRVLDLMLNYSIRRGRDLNLVLQIFDRDFEQVLHATRAIADELNERGAQDPRPEKNVKQVKNRRIKKPATRRNGAKKKKS